MKVIVTKYVGPTSTRGAKMVAKAEGVNPVSVGYDYELNDEQNNITVAAALRDKYGWKGEMVGGQLANGDYVWVFVKGSPVVHEKGETRRKVRRNPAKKKSIMAPLKKRPQPARAAKTVRVVSSSVKVAQKTGPQVQVSDNGKTWKTISVFQNAQTAKEYARAIYERYDGKKYVRVV